MTHRAALLTSTAILSRTCLIPLFTGFFSVPVEYPWPRVVFRNWRRPLATPLNGARLL